MKNFVSFLVVLVTLSLFTSCQKESIESMDSVTQTAQTGEFTTGEELPMIEGISTAEIAEIRTEQIATYAKYTEKGEMAFVQNAGQSTSRSRTVTNIYCGSNRTGTTLGERSTVNKSTGEDKVYLIDLDDKTKVTINLTNLSADLDLYLAKVMTDSYGRKLIGSYLASSEEWNYRSEVITAELERGEYFIIVESYRNSGSYRIGVTCESQQPSFEHCETYEQYTPNYNTGIAAQSNLWNRWSSNAGDALVLHEAIGNYNQVVKIDNGRFGYQDVVRDFTGLTLNSGKHAMNFNLYVPSNGIAEMLSEKTSRYGQEQGFKIEIRNQRLILKYKNQIYTANTRIASNTWHEVKMTFDAESNRVYVTIAGIRITMKADAKLGSTYRGQQAIHGINFFGYESNSKFHIDNVCVTELEEGYDDPTKIFDSSVESIDLSGK